MLDFLKVFTVIMALYCVPIFTAYEVDCWKDNQAMQEWNGSVQGTVSILADNTPTRAIKEEPEEVCNKVIVAYCKEKGIRRMPSLTIKRVSSSKYYSNHWGDICYIPNDNTILFVLCDEPSKEDIPYLLKRLVKALADYEEAYDSMIIK